MEDLKNYREKLDLIDEEMKKLFLERMEIVKEIGAFKKENNIKVEDKNREIEMLKRLSNNISDELKPYYESFLKDIINISKDYQKK